MHDDDSSLEVPKVQYIPGVAWDCVVTDSMQKVTKEEQDNDKMINEILNAGFANMNMKG